MDTASTPIEAEKRSENFDGEHAATVTLADGQEWHLPLPRLVIRPTFRDGEAVSHRRYPTAGPELDARLARIAEAPDYATQVLETLALGAALLRKNYDLSDDELGAVLWYEVGSPVSDAMLASIVAAATGASGPKR